MHTSYYKLMYSISIIKGGWFNIRVDVHNIQFRLKKHWLLNQGSCCVSLHALTTVPWQCVPQPRREVKKWYTMDISAPNAHKKRHCNKKYQFVKTWSQIWYHFTILGVNNESGRNMWSQFLTKTAARTHSYSEFSVTVHPKNQRCFRHASVHVPLTSRLPAN